MGVTATVPILPRAAVNSPPAESPGCLCSPDIETSALQQLAELRAAVAGEVRDADGIAATRAVLLAVFEHFTLHPGTVADLEPEDGPGPADDDPTVDAVAAEGYVILTKPRAAAVVGIDEDWRPVLRKQALPLPANSDGEGLPTCDLLQEVLFAPISVRTGA